MKDEVNLREIPEQYKEILQGLMNEGDLETVLFLRILMETGIRSIDVYKLEPACIQQRNIVIMESKRPQYYELEGRYPKISKKTEQIAKILVEKQGKYFTKNSLYFKRKIEKYSKDYSFMVHYLRHYRKIIAYELRQ